MPKKRYTEALQHQLFPYLTKAADQLGYETYVIGGFVRDYFLKRKQKEDIDIVCVGDGIELAKKTAKLLPGSPKVQVFKTYGTAMLQVFGVDVEFVGARKESYTKDSRKPSVKSGNLTDDQNRRDFTINALAFKLNTEGFGELLDPFEGLEHLKQQLIITPLDPDITFSDDPLRMLRAIRFSSQLKFFIDPKALEAIQKNASRLKIISNERIVTEINKILETPQPSLGFKLLHKTGLLQLILPELTALEGIDEVEGQRHKDNFWHTLEVVDNIARETNNLWLRWAALLHDIGKAPTKKFNKRNGWTFHGHEFIGSKMVYKIFKRLKMPLNDKMKFVQKLVLLSSRPIAIVDDNVTDSAVRRLVFDAGDYIEDLMILCEADITTKNPKRFKRYHNNFKIVRQRIQDVEERDKIRDFQPPVSGKIIMETLSIQPCREVGLIKNDIKEAILEGDIPNEYGAAFDYMLKSAQKFGLKPKL